MGGEGPGEFGFNGHQPLQPLAGQKRGFPFAGRGGSPGEFFFFFIIYLPSYFLCLSCLVCDVVAAE